RRKLAAVAAAADHRDRSLRVELAGRAGHDGVQRNVEGALDPPGGPLVRLAAVHELDLVQPLVDAARRGELALEVVDHRNPNPIRVVGYPRARARPGRARARTPRTRRARGRPGRAGRTAPPRRACAPRGRLRSPRGRPARPGTRTPRWRSRETPPSGRRARRPRGATRCGSSRGARRDPPTPRTPGRPGGSPSAPEGRRPWWPRPCRSEGRRDSGCGGS